MAALLGLLQVALGIGSLVCFIMVIIKMFQHDATTLAIVSLLLLLCGIGALIVFIYGWIKHAEWGITNVMYAWTGCFIGGIIVSFMSYTMMPVQ